MRPLNPSEIELLAKTLNRLVGARFQKVLSSQEDVILELWYKGENYYLWFHDSSLRPFLTFWPEKLPFQIKKKVIPVALFLNAHLVNRHLTAVDYSLEYGRVLTLEFGEGHSIEFRIFPHGQNLSAKAIKNENGKVSEKHISMHKLSPLGELKAFETNPSEIRSVFDFSMEWKLSRNPIKSLKPKSKSEIKEPVAPTLNKAKNKIQVAIEKVEKELERKQSLLWRPVGDHLKTAQSMEDVPTDFEPYLDRKRSLSWNMNRCFEEAKETQRKIEGTLKRLEELRHRQKKIDSEGVLPKRQEESKPTQKLKEKVDHVRSFKLSEEVRALCGRSAKENLALLRQAKTWDLWIHLRDLPSSHAIVFRPKNRKISESELVLVIQWFFKQSLGKKWESQIGERFDVVVTECRHVKPIKGDRIGRVHYQNEKVLRLTVQA